MNNMQILIAYRDGRAFSPTATAAQQNTKNNFTVSLMIITAMLLQQSILYCCAVSDIRCQFTLTELCGQEWAKTFWMWAGAGKMIPIFCGSGRKQDKIWQGWERD